jgi:Adenosine-deaminase (editase) domain
MYGHLSRAFYHRLLRDAKLPDANVLELPTGFRINCPIISHTKIGKCSPETEKSTAVSVVWHRGAKIAEVIDGTLGNFSEDIM